MTVPRISVAIAFHDEARHLAAAVRSVLAQTERNFELILLDDGSTDASLAIARSFLDDPRVSVHVGESRRQLGHRLNQAVGLARAPFFARMDGDDICHPTRLATQLRFLESRPETVAVGTWAALVDEDEAPFAVIEASPRSASHRDVLARGLIPHATMMARTEWLRANPYDERLARAEDRDLWCRVAGTARIDVLDEVLYVIRVLADGEGFLTDYMQGQADLRRVMRRYGPFVVGRIPTLRLLATSVLKTVAVAGVALVGHQRRLVRRRGRTPTVAERNRVEEALRAAYAP